MGQFSVNWNCQGMPTPLPPPPCCPLAHLRLIGLHVVSPRPPAAGLRIALLFPLP